MDKYHVREDFIATRDKFIPRLFILSYEINARDLGYCEELQVLQRYTTIHEKLLYLTTHSLILGMSGLSCSYLQVNQEIEKIFDQEKLEEDRLDPFVVGMYYHFKGVEVVGNFWFHNQYDYRLQYYLKSLKYYKKTGLHDRIVFLSGEVAELYFSLGDFDSGNEYFQEAISLNNKSDQIPQTRKKNLDLRIRISRLYNNSQFYPKSEHLQEAKTLFHEIITIDFENVMKHALDISFIFLAEVFIRFNEFDKIQELQNLTQQFVVEKNTILSKVGFQLYDEIRGIPIFSLYIEGIIKINKIDLLSNLEGYKTLQELVDNMSTFFSSKILKYQLNFLLKRYRGFLEPDVLNEMGDKINKLIEIGISNKNGNDWLNGVLLSARHKLLTQEVHEVIDYLESTKKQFIEFGQDDLVQLIEHEISELMTLDLSPEHADRIQQLQLQKYIKKVNEVMKRM